MSNPKWTIAAILDGNGTLANFAIDSIKQLRDAATKDVVVAVQFHPGGLFSAHDVRRYIFDGTNRDKPFRDKTKFWEDKKHLPLNMASPETLSDFMNWVYRHCKADNYCLDIWMDGPGFVELPGIKERPPAGIGTAFTTQRDSEHRLYFTPLQLKNALKNTDPTESKKLRIIALDACAMSNLETIYELRNLADFLVASQADVPDQSFTYPGLVTLFRNESTAAEVCRKGVEEYVRAYQQYLCNEATGTQPVTLAAIQLRQKMEGVKQPLRELARVLLSATDRSGKAIYNARKKSQSFAGGLFSDLHDFCDKLMLEEIPEELKDACKEISRAIQSIVLTRAGAVNGRFAGPDDPKLLSYGLSIYLPWINNAGLEKRYTEEDLVKGLPRMLDKDSEIRAGFLELKTLANRIRQTVCRKMIKNIENYYTASGCDFAQDTGWYEFIQLGWSPILAKYNPDDLDSRYPAKQCTKNLLNFISHQASTDESARKDQPTKPAAGSIAQWSNGGMHPPHKEDRPRQ